MAGIYFILPKTSNQGYIGLDSYMTDSSFPRLLDHIAAAYGIYGRDIYRGSYKAVTAGAVRKSIQHCEAFMREQCCCNFEYKIVLKENNCYGLGQDNYTAFCRTWKSTYKEPEMSWAEMYYVYKYSDKYAALNDAWGGAGNFNFNVEALNDAKVGDTTIKKLATDAKITWFPNRSNKTDEHMYDLFFPYAKVFNTVITYYVNNFILPDISKALYKALSTKALWEENSKNINIDVKKIVDGDTKLKEIRDAIVNSAPSGEYSFPDVDILKQEITTTLKNAIKSVVDDIFNTINTAYTKEGNFNKRRINKTFNISIPLQKFSKQIKTKSDFPNWWPKQDAFQSASDVTSQMKNLIPTTIFPYLVNHAQKFSLRVGINKDMIWRYLDGIKSGLVNQSNFTYGFYFPCRNLWLDKYNGVIDYVDESHEEYVLIHRSAWAPDAYEKLKRSAFETSKNLREVTLW